jgi:hypothetical protein
MTSPSVAKMRRTSRARATHAAQHPDLARALEDRHLDRVDESGAPHQPARRKRSRHRWRARCTARVATEPTARRASGCRRHRDARVCGHAGIVRIPRLESSGPDFAWRLVPRLLVISGDDDVADDAGWRATCARQRSSVGEGDRLSASQHRDASPSTVLGRPGQWMLGGDAPGGFAPQPRLMAAARRLRLPLEPR